MQRALIDEGGQERASRAPQVTLINNSPMALASIVPSLRVDREVLLLVRARQAQARSLEASPSLRIV